MAKLDDFQRIRILTRTRWKKFCENLRLWISQKDYEEMKRTLCPVCGKNLNDSQIYFGENICGKCKHDLDPQNIYEKHIKGKMGFKGPPCD